MDRDTFVLTLNIYGDESYNAGYCDPDDPQADAHRMKAGVAQGQLLSAFNELDRKAHAYDAMLRIIDTYRQTHSESAP